VSIKSPKEEPAPVVVMSNVPLVILVDCPLLRK